MDVPPRFEQRFFFVLPQYFSWLGRWQARLPRRLGKEAPRRWGAARSLYPNIAIALGTRLRVPFAIQKGCASYVLAFERLSVRPRLREEWRPLESRRSGHQNAPHTTPLRSEALRVCRLSGFERTTVLEARI